MALVPMKWSRSLVAPPRPRRVDAAAINAPACAPMEWLTATRNWRRFYAQLSNGERRDLMGLSCNTLDFFFGRQLFRPYEYGCEQSRSCVFHLCIFDGATFSTPPFSVAPRKPGRFFSTGKFLRGLSRKYISTFYLRSPGSNVHSKRQKSWQIHGNLCTLSLVL